MKIAIVHDYLREYGGAERVVETLHEIWPEAPVYTSFIDWPSFAKAPAGKLELFKSWDIRTSWVQKYPLIMRYISPLRFLAPNIWSSFDLSEYDIVISSSGWFMCRGVIVNKPAIQICYIHHPPRNLYGYVTGSDLQKYWSVRVYAAIVNFFLRHYDYETAQKVDYFIANSKETASRVKKFYRRESAVIYPPVEVDSGHPPAGEAGWIVDSRKKRTYFLSVGRLTWSKRVDVAIEACNKLKLPLKVVGMGKEDAYLRTLAGPTIEFVGSVSDEELSKLYAGAKALLFCALDEDFGMVPVEAMAHGTPVIALAQGGVLETVVDGKTGVFFHEPTAESLMGAIRKLNNDYKNYNDYNYYKNYRERFSKERFVKELKKFVESVV